MGIVLQLLLGLSLASAAGLRAFLPLLVLAVAARFHVAHIGGQFAWLHSNAAIIVLAVATVAELLADKLPIVDHALDVLQTVVRPAAGALAVAGTQAHLDPMTAAIVGLILGAPLAAGFHVAKGATRVASTATTAGPRQPLPEPHGRRVLAGNLAAGPLAARPGLWYRTDFLVLRLAPVESSTKKEKDCGLDRTPQAHAGFAAQRVEHRCMTDQPPDLFDRLIAIQREAMATRQYGAAYHALAAALHLAQNADDERRLTDVAALAADALAFIDRHAPDYEHSTRSAATRGHVGIFGQLAQQARTRRQMAEHNNRVHDAQTARASTPTERE